MLWTDHKVIPAIYSLVFFISSQALTVCLLITGLLEGKVVKTGWHVGNNITPSAGDIWFIDFFFFTDFLQGEVCVLGMCTVKVTDMMTSHAHNVCPCRPNTGAHVSAWSHDSTGVSVALHTWGWGWGEGRGIPAHTHTQWKYLLPLSNPSALLFVWQIPVGAWVRRQELCHRLLHEREKGQNVDESWSTADTFLLALRLFGLKQ